jgi:hypothetical protein
MSTAPQAELDGMLAAIRACRRCVEAPQGKPLPHEPRPVLRASASARLAVCSQAPGTKVHASGTPFTDASGDRLREWMGVSPQEFYDETRVAIVPMGFCFPGQDANGADLPPRRECAPLWHRDLFAALPQIELVLALLRASLPSRRGGGEVVAGDNARLAPAPARQAASARAALAPPILAQQQMAHRQSVVRGRASAGAAPEGEGTLAKFALVSGRIIIY